MSAGGDGPAPPGCQRWRTEGTSWGWRLGEASVTPRHSVTQRDRSCVGRTTERGTGTGLTGCRKAVIINAARFRAPGRSSVEAGRSGDVHGQTTGRKGSRERGGVCEEAMSDEPLTNFGQELDFVSCGLRILSHKGRGRLAATSRRIVTLRMQAKDAPTLPLPLWERIRRPHETKSSAWPKLVRG